MRWPKLKMLRLFIDFEKVKLTMRTIEICIIYNRKTYGCVRPKCYQRECLAL